MEGVSCFDEDDPGQLPWFHQDKQVSHAAIHTYLSSFFLLLPLISQSCTHIRSAMAEGFQIDLPCCNKSNCEIHTSNPWPLLQEVLAFSVKDLGPRLKELVLYLSRCSRSTLDYTTWVDNFAAANKVANICIVSTPPETIDVSTHYLYHWGLSSSATDLEDLIKKTISGGKVHIEIVGDSTLRDIPNIFEIMGNQNIQKYFLATNFKIKSLGHNLNTLSSCRGLILDDRVVSFDAEEIDVMNRMLAHIAVEPRTRGPEYINLPKVSSSSFVMPLPYSHLLLFANIQSQKPFRCLYLSFLVVHKAILLLKRKAVKPYLMLRQTNSLFHYSPYVYLFLINCP